MAKTGTFNHLSLSASNYEVSKKFYNFFLVDLLGYTLIMEHPYYTMWKLPTGEAICVSPGSNVPHHKSNPGINHVALNVETHEQIDEFYEKIVKFQAENKDTMSASVILDKPALYPQYSSHYYALFFTDPDNIKLEIAYVKH
ncbi:hypothetical protein BGZ76_009525 [Entomortierella beljakovae]|nr:hypothetical protein BGZ76_009525 [Entomortierella beljakovae]